MAHTHALADLITVPRNIARNPSMASLNGRMVAGAVDSEIQSPVELGTSVIHTYCNLMRTYYIYIYTHMPTYTHVRACAYTCTYACANTYTHIFMSTCIHVCIYVAVVYLYIYICMCMSLYIYTDIHMHVYSYARAYMYRDICIQHNL